MFCIIHYFHFKNHMRSLRISAELLQYLVLIDTSYTHSIIKYNFPSSNNLPNKKFYCAIIKYLNCSFTL